jgi:hypothetical protein
MAEELQYLLFLLNIAFFIKGARRTKQTLATHQYAGGDEKLQAC